MQLVIYNGSPRLENSNSTILINQFLNGYHKIIDDEATVYYLARLNEMDEFLHAFKNTDYAIIVFPLYTDSMPGVVKQFFEILAKAKPHKNVKLGFIVQSGFPEGIHCENTKRYLQKFSNRIDCFYLGTLTKGGVEGVQMMPAYMTRKLFTGIQRFGEYFARTGRFNEEIILEMSKPYKMSIPKMLLMRLLSSAGITNFYWNMHLRKNKAYRNRHNQPFVEKETPILNDFL
jgi:hypothetical protein